MAHHHLSPQEFGDGFQRWLDKMKDCGKSDVLRILKGHLLIEEQLVGIIEDKLDHPGLLDSDVSLSFLQKLKIAEKLVSNSNAAVIRTTFAAANCLNRIRNTLAHSLDAPTLPSKLGDFFDILSTHPVYSHYRAKGILKEGLRGGLYIVYFTFLLLRGGWSPDEMIDDFTH